MHYLALCCIVKDEDPFISEWLIWHALAGVEHFYVYDNESAVPVKRNPILAALLAAGRATVYDIEGRHRQYAAYDHCFRRHGPDNFWIAALDLDEFVYQSRPEARLAEWLDFRPFLAEFEDRAGLGLNWSTMASAGHLKRPQGLVTDLYREKLLGAGNSDYHIKTFLRAACYAGASNTPHNFAVLEGASVVNESHHPIPPERPFFVPFNERAWVYHYFFKSQQDFEDKTRRGRADVGLSPEAAAARYAAFQTHTAMPCSRDSRAAALAPLVRRWLERGEPPPLPPEPDPAAGLDGYLDLCDAFLAGHSPNQEEGEPAWADYFRVADLSVSERFNRAEAVLCRAALRHGREARLWTTRARLARQQYAYARAERFLDQALSRGETFAVYEEWFQLCLARAAQQRGPAGDAPKILRQADTLLAYLKLQAGKDEASQRKLAMHEKMLGKVKLAVRQA